MKIPYTNIPNFLFILFNTLSLSEERILLNIIRQTIGYHREEYETTITELSKTCNLTRKYIYSNLKSLEDKKCISVKKLKKSIIIKFSTVNCEKVFFNL